VVQCELHQLDLTENENLKLTRDRFHGKELSRAKVTGTGVIDRNVEVTGFRQCEIERFLDGRLISQVQSNRMQSRHSWDAFQIAGCGPDFMTLSEEGFCNGQTNTRTCACEKNSFHDLENGFGSRKALRVATELIRILTIASMQERLAKQSQYCANPVKGSQGVEMSILLRCCH